MTDRHRERERQIHTKGQTGQLDNGFDNAHWPFVVANLCENRKIFVVLHPHTYIGISYCVCVCGCTDWLAK